MKDKKKEKTKIVRVLDCSFELKLTSEEAYEIVHRKNGKVAKANRKYMNDLLFEIAKKCLVKCKEEDLKEEL